MKVVYSASLLLLLGGCMSASSVKVDGPSASSYAPINELISEGEISYCNAGLKSIRDARRKDAYEKMYSACGGSYQIVREEEQNAAFCKMERRIWFQCASGEAPGAIQD